MVTALSAQQVQLACKAALKQRLQSKKIAANEKGYVSQIAGNLVDGVMPYHFEADLRQGGGNELVNKFLAAHSSSALVVNTFAPFRADLSFLWLPSGNDFSEAQFERKCPHGVNKDLAPPNLDLIAEGPRGVAAIELKLLEYLEPPKVEFSEAYERDIQDWRRYGPWFKEMRSLKDNSARYNLLDAAQLVKHAFGVARTFSGRRATLIYLFWEPLNHKSRSGNILNCRNHL